jgi:hypothetical protein
VLGLWFDKFTAPEPVEGPRRRGFYGHLSQAGKNT